MTRPAPQRTTRVIAFSLIWFLAAAPTTAQDKVDDLLLLPDSRIEYSAEDPILARTWRRTANESYRFVNETVSDSWNLLGAPLDWEMREWLLLGGLAGVATGFIYGLDNPIRKQALGSSKFHKFGNDIRFLSDGTGLAVLTGGFLLSGMLHRDKEIETARMLLSASIIGYGATVVVKRGVGRERPGPHGPRQFDPFSDNFSMPSGEVSNAFVMATIVSQQYPNWPVRILSYGLATTVGAGRLARDDHWASDVIVGAAIGTAIGYGVSQFHYERRAMNTERKKLGLAPKQERVQHSLSASTRSLQWRMRF
ncbi:MAG: phosphatase PAP2 family protein [Myxococcota bacterium]|nr:phosphatase PAP2 family protein [Myxococcota bacterium]